MHDGYSNIPRILVGPSWLMQFMLKRFVKNGVHVTSDDHVSIFNSELLLPFPT
jgi:hypothetical protein